MASHLSPLLVRPQTPLADVFLVRVSDGRTQDATGSMGSVGSGTSEAVGPISHIWLQ